MDKKQNLDPALKATYERVMGISLPSTPTSTPTSSPTPVPAPTSNVISTPPQSQPHQPVVAPQGSKVVVGNSNATKVVAGGSRKSGGLSPILIGVAIILFFAIYTFVWLFVFKVNLPFIPKLF